MVAGDSLNQEKARLATESGAGALSRIVTSKGFPFIQFGSAVVAWGLWYQNPSAGWVLAVALAPLALKLLIGQMPIRRTPLDLPLGVFLLTAGLGVWAAYDRAGPVTIFANATPAGWQTLWGLALAVLIFYVLAAMRTETQQRWTLALLAGIGTAIALWFAAAHDWRADPAKLATITRLGVVVQAWLPRLPVPGLHPNATGRILATFLPMSLGLAVEVFGRNRKRRWAWAAWGLATGIVMAFSLILTTSRGAWLGVGCGLTLGAVWWLMGRLSHGRRRLILFLGLIGLGGLTGVALAALLPSLRVALQESQAMANRLGIFSEAALLVRDYPFTGVGLGEFALVHSTYALLIHVPTIPHAHSLLLDIALGQGVLGALAAVGVLSGAAWLGLSALAHAKQPVQSLAAGLLSLAAVTVHDLVDDPLYHSWGAILLWVSAGLVVAGWQRVGAESWPTARSRSRRWQILGIVAVAGLALLGLFWRPIGAAWYANLGAVYQTQAELRHYDPNHFDNPTLDQIRAEVDLSAAEKFFMQALALSPGQVTARTRLAEIALGRGQYNQALAHVQAAWEAGHRDRVTRLLLGDALVATGEMEAGVEIARGLGWAEGRLNGQAWYRYWVGGDYRRAADAWNAVLKLNPESDYAKYWKTEAEARAEN